MTRMKSMKESLLATWITASLAATAACVTTGDEGGDTDDGVPSAVALTMPAPDARRVLELVNDPGTDVALLDDTVKLDARAAKNIIAHRNGGDGVAPSADDHPFASLDELDAIAYVGDSALSKLEAYANAHPPAAGATVEGVGFSGWQAAAVTWGVSRASLRELDVDVALDGRAAANIVAHAPYTTAAAIGPIAQVGPSALGALRAHAFAWWQRMHAPAPACDLAFTVIPLDADTVSLEQVVEMTTAPARDYPFAEVVALQIDPCVLADPTQRVRLVPGLVGLGKGVINWAIDTSVAPPLATALTTGPDWYVSQVQDLGGAIADLVAGNGWTPANADEQKLYAKLPSLITAVTGSPQANPTDYVGIRLYTDADECSEWADISINASNGLVSIAHVFPRC
jgi:hypothetical protein